MGSTELRPRIIPIFSFSDNPNLLIKLYMVLLLCRNSNYVKLSAGYLSAGCMWLTSKTSLLRIKYGRYPTGASSGLSGAPR
jgi:hypothetical protein